MDLRWPIMGGTVLAAAGAGAGIWQLEGAIGPAVAAGAGVAALGGVALEMALRRAEVSKLQKQLLQVRQMADRVDSDVALAKDGMIAVHQALADGGGAKRQMKAMVDEMAVMQRQLGQLQAANSRGGRVTQFPKRTAEPDMSPDEVLEKVRDALAEGRIDLFMQPVVTLPQRQRRYYECFSRVPDGANGLLAADSYVAAAEEAGLIAPIDNLLLFRAVQLVRRARARNAHVGFFCNVSRHTLKDRDFLADFIEFLEENPELAPSLIFEIAQNDWDPGDAELQRYMESLTAIGVRFSLDRVEEFDVDGALLRRRGFRFVKGAPSAFLSENGPDAHRMKRRLALDGIELIVEKVESERDLVELLEFDVALGQGFLFGEPKVAPEADAA